MSPEFDVIIVGSGPAGVSAAFPLVQAGLKVLMVDGGKKASVVPPSRPFLTERFNDPEQWKWMVGENFHALQKIDAISPKLRVPTHNYVFENFIESNRIKAENFIVVGSLAKGGLSNAWGCGVARLSSKELAEFPFPEQDIERSYEAVSRRIGVSGANTDDLSDYFGLDAWAQAPVQMDPLHQWLFERYSSRSSERVFSPGFRLGRTRTAVLTHDEGERKACDLSGNCFWGCHRRALYSSADELPSLIKHENFYYQSGFIVAQVANDGGCVSVAGQFGQDAKTVTAKKVVLAAGTLASTRLVLSALKFDAPIRLQSCPTAAFLLWLPKMLGAPKSNSFGLGQLSFTLDLTNEVTAFGSTLSAVGIPVAEFVRHLPLRKRYGIDLLRHLLSSCLVGNLFLPGHLASTKVSLNTDGELLIKGGYSESVYDLMRDAAIRLRKSYWSFGALLLPMSFTIGRAGGDIHYSCTLPMRLKPVLGETDAEGEVIGLAGVHIADGACLPILSEKSHTLTIMANADRIGRVLAAKMKGNNEN
ncbi:MAG: FAD-dependent oxidoreductase [Methylobacter sp.]